MSRTVTPEDVCAALVSWDDQRAHPRSGILLSHEVSNLQSIVEMARIATGPIHGPITPCSDAETLATIQHAENTHTYQAYIAEIKAREQGPR